MAGKTYKQYSLRILFWNARSFLRRINELRSKIVDYDILVIVESWLKQDDRINVPGYLTLRMDRTHRRGGGILLLIKSDLAYKEMGNITSPDESVEMYGVRLNGVYPPLDLLVCYRTPGFTLTQRQWKTIIDNIDINSHCIFVGDFDSHNVLWNCSYSDVNGERLLEAIDDKGLFLHNENSNTYINIHNYHKSNIDLIFSTMNIENKIDLKVSDETWGSDHFPIIIYVDTEKHQYNRKSFKFYSKRTNWERVNEILEENFEHLIENQMKDTFASMKYDHFVKLISDAITASSPVKRSVEILNTKKVHREKN